jgi:hypothetical protein
MISGDLSARTALDVYLLTADADRYQWLDLIADHGQVEHLSTGRALSGSYETMKVQVLDDRANRRLPAGEFAQLNYPVPVLSRRAADALEDLLRDDAELLPLESDDRDYCVLNVTRVVDALDVARSEVKRFRSGGIMRVLRYELRREAIEPVTIFRLPELLVDVYVTDAFRAAVEAARLEGLAWDRLVWSDDPERTARGGAPLQVQA